MLDSLRKLQITFDLTVYLSTALILLAFLAFPMPVRGQSSIPISSNVSASKTEVVRVATVNLQDASVRQNGNDFTISFTLSNRIGTQPGIKYGVSLVQTGEGGQKVIDHAVSDKVLTLGPGESVERTILYSAPKVPPGTYSLVLVSESQFGFPFGMNFLGNYTLTDVGEGVFVSPGQCYLTTEEVSDVHYSLNEGVDVADDESLYLNCVINNESGSEYTLFPRVVTHERSTFGTVVPTGDVPDTPLSVLPGERKNVVIKLPKATQPQSYAAVVRFSEESNAVTARYVVRGGSGTLQNITFDKSTYKKGETAQVSVFWTKSADSFMGARNGSGTELPSPSLVLGLKNSSGEYCASPSPYTLEGERETILVPIERNCDRFDVEVSLTDTTYGTLGTVTYEVPPPAQPHISENERREKQKRLNVIVLSSVIALGALVVLFRYLWKYRTKKVTTTLVFALCVMGMSFAVDIPKAHADSFWAFHEVEAVEGVFGGFYRAILYTVNLDKTVYTAGETMELTGSGNIQGECGNWCETSAECRAAGMWASKMDGSDIDPVYIIPLVQGGAAGNASGEMFFGAAELPAPSRIGTHTLTIEGIATPDPLSTTDYGVDLHFAVAGASELPPELGGPPRVPTVTNPTHESVTFTDAILGATITSDGGRPILWRGTCWGTELDPSDNCIPDGEDTLGTFSHLRNGLPPRTTIYYRGYAENDVGIGYSSSNAFDTNMLPDVTLTLCTLGGTNCVTNGDTKYIYAGEEVEVTWNSDDATSCVRTEGPADFEVLSISDTDSTVTEPPYNGTQIFRVECTNGETRDAEVTLITNGQSRCPQDEINGCSVLSREDGERLGVCASGYRGTCEYECEGDTRTWKLIENQCVVPLITSFVICDKGKNDASCSSNKVVPPGTEATLRWTSRNTTQCRGDNFDTGNRTSGFINVTASTDVNVTTTYGLMCENNGVPTYPKSATLTTSTNAPDLRASNLRVRIGATVELSWDTGGVDETSCTLDGGGVNGVEALGNSSGTNRTGSVDVVISGRTVFALTCAGLTDTVTVEVIPVTWEE